MTDPFLERVRELRRKGFDLQAAWLCAERELDVARRPIPSPDKKADRRRKRKG